jgi:hypothetical protein
MVCVPLDTKFTKPVYEENPHIILVTKIIKLVYDGDPYQ